MIAVPGLISLGPCQASVLFDATKLEQAGNADWVIDEDNGVAARYPTPAPSDISASTAETYWTGGLSAWGVTMVKRGVAVETLPSTGSITYGNEANAQDLKHYTVYAVVEPNKLFTTAEKTAMINYVKNGGSLFMVSDHGGSDRDGDGDGYDSVDAWNDFLTTANTGGLSFGFTFNGNTTTPSAPAVDTASADPITHGAVGTAGDFAYSSGSTLTLTGGNISAAVWASSAKSAAQVMVAYGTYGLGRFVAIGDSSPLDDDTGGSGHTLYNGWTGDANGNDATLITNATLWLNAVPEPAAAALLGLPALLAARPLRRTRARSTVAMSHSGRDRN